MSLTTSVNAVLALEEAAVGTQFSADDDERSAFGSLIDADRWMIFYNAVNKVLHWDFVSVASLLYITMAHQRAVRACYHDSSPSQYRMISEYKRICKYAPY